MHQNAFNPPCLALFKQTNTTHALIQATNIVFLVPSASAQQLSTQVVSSILPSCGDPSPSPSPSPAPLVFAGGPYDLNMGQGSDKEHNVVTLGGWAVLPCCSSSPGVPNIT